MFVMAEMARMAFGIVLGIDAHCRPTELQRQEDKQQDGEPTVHGRNSSSYSAIEDNVVEAGDNHYLPYHREERLGARQTQGDL